MWGSQQWESNGKPASKLLRPTVIVTQCHDPAQDISMAVGMSEHAQYLSQSWQAEEFVSTPTFWICKVAQNRKLKRTWVVFCSSLATGALAICLVFLPVVLLFSLDVADSQGSLCPSSLWCSSARCCLGMRKSPPAALSLVPSALLITWSPKGSQKSFLN